MVSKALQTPLLLGFLALSLSGCGKPEAPAPVPTPKPGAPAKASGREQGESAKRTQTQPSTVTVPPPGQVETTPPAPIELPAAERQVLEQRQAGELKLRQVQQHAQGLTDPTARRTFLIEWFRLEEQLIAKEQEKQVVAVQAGIQEIEEQLKWPDDKLKTLAAGKTPVEIRAALQAKLGAEKSRLSANQKMLRFLRMDLNSVRKPFAADLK